MKLWKMLKRFKHDKSLVFECDGYGGSDKIKIYMVDEFIFKDGARAANDVIVTKCISEKVEELIINDYMMNVDYREVKEGDVADVSKNVHDDWTPKYDEIYYYPEFGLNDLYFWYHWNHDKIDQRIKRVSGIYKTK